MTKSRGPRSHAVTVYGVPPNALGEGPPLTTDLLNLLSVTATADDVFHVHKIDTYWGL